MKNLLALLVFVTSPLALATYDLTVTDHFEEVVSTIDAVTNEHAPEDVLVVFDIDHTLILVDDCLPKAKKSERNKKGKNKESFARFMKQVWECTSYLTNPALPELIEGLQDADYPVMALTARGGNLVDPTIEQLKNRLRYSKEKGSGKAVIEFIEDNAPAYSTEEKEYNVYEVDGRKGKYFKKVTYKEGVALVGGADKGKALKGFLKEIGRSYKQIIFVDDSQRNITNLENAYADTEEHMTIIHYTEFDRKKKK